jgi:hypothetical protein
VLGLDSVGTRDDFFDLGGHSLLAVTLIARIHEALRVRVPLRRIFDDRSVEKLAAWLSQAEGTEEASPAEPARTDGPVPLAAEQLALWAFQSLHPESVAYHVADAIRLSGPADISALERALAEIVVRHSTLRTAIFDGEVGPMQVVHPPHPVPLTFEDLLHLEGEEALEAVQAAATRLERIPFDLSAGQLLRATLVRLRPDEHDLLVCMHHIATDAWSLGLLRQELDVLYGAFRRGEPSPLAPLPIDYAGYAARQQEAGIRERDNRELAYWTERLASAPILEIPTDHARVPGRDARGATVPFEVPTPLAEALRSIAAREGATLYMVLLTAFQVLLCRYTDQEDVVVGTRVSTRAEDTVGLIGCFVNTVALRTDLSGTPSFRQALQAVRETVLEAQAHRSVPLHRVAAALGRARHPLFQVLFTFHRDNEFADGTVEELGDLAARADMNLVMVDGGSSLGGILVYDAELFEPDRPNVLASSYGILLQEIAGAPEAAIDEYAIVPVHDHDQLAASFLSEL